MSLYNDNYFQYDCLQERPLTIYPSEWCLLKFMTMKFEFQKLCPNLTKFAEVVLSLPVRGAGKIKLIKTNARNLMKNDMLQGLLQMQINGPLSILSHVMS